MEGPEGTTPCPSRCCERQFFDSSRIACCYFRSTNASAGDRSVGGQGILLQLDSNTLDSHERQLVVLTSHQLVPSLSSARNWVIGFCESKKEFPLNDYVDQGQLRVVTCCGPDDGCLWDKRKDHPVSTCPMRGGCSVILLGKDLSQEVLAEIGSMVMFTGDDIMPVKAAQEVLHGGPPVIVYHRNKTTVFSSPFQINKPHADESTLLSSNLNWYHKYYSTFDYSPNSGALPFPGAPIIYCEPNTGKPWLLGMHVYLETQAVQYGVSVGHILELLQCNLCLSLCGGPHDHIPKLSLLNLAVQNNICSPRYYENISLFLDNFGCASLELTDLLQITHYLASELLLFAQSESFYDDSGIRRASLLLLQALSKLFKKFDPGVVTATVDGVKEWCSCLTAEDIQKGFCNLCQQLAFSILPDQDKEEIVEMWFKCWNNLLSLNGLITDPIMQCQLFPTFQRCQSLYPRNVCVQKCFGEMMAACLTTQFHKLSVFEAQQVRRDEECREMRSTMLELKEKARLYDVEREAQPQQEPPSVGQSTEVLLQKILEQERLILLLRSQLDASEKDRRDLQAYMQQRYVYPGPILEGYKKQDYGLGIDKDPEGYMGNGHRNNLSQHSETDGPHGTGHQSGNIFDSQHTRRTLSVPNTSTPVRPTRLQRRANSDAAYSNSSSISSGYPSHGPSLESSLDSSDASRRFYQHQQSTVSTTSTDSSQYATPIASTPDFYLQRYVGIENKGSFHQQAIEETVEIEAVYKRIVQENFTEFTRQTQIKCISSLLIQRQLISHDECQKLNNETGNSLTFYTEILPRKGAGAYTLFRCCIREETEHRGHTCLNDLFIIEERKVGIVPQD